MLTMLREQLIEHLKNGRQCSNIANIAHQEKNMFIRTRNEKEENEITNNIIDYSIFPDEDLGEFLSIRTSKGCAYQCSFCSYFHGAGKYTYLSTEQVQLLLDKIQKLGRISTLSFIDDTLNFPKERFKEILRNMIKKKYSFKWNGYFRCSHADEEMIDLMKESGCEGVFLGVESDNNQILKNMNKNTTVDSYRQIISLLNKAGIISHANIIIGFPGETEETIQETINLIEETAPTTYRAQIWYADTTTPIFKRKEEFEIKGSGFNWTHKTMNSKMAFNYVEKLFFNIKNSVWLPDWGFEQWSIFYLQRKGMDLETIKSYLALFNSCVKDRLRDPAKRNISESVLNQIQDLCKGLKT